MIGSPLFYVSFENFSTFCVPCGPWSEEVPPPQYPLPSVKDDYIGSVLRMRPAPGNSSCGTINTPPCRRTESAEHRHSPGMVTSPCERNILECDVKQQTYIQSYMYATEMIGGGFFIVLHLLRPRFLRYHPKTSPYIKQGALLPTLSRILKCITIYKNDNGQ